MTPEEFALWFVGDNSNVTAAALRGIVTNAIVQWELKREKDATLLCPKCGKPMQEQNTWTDVHHFVCFECHTEKTPLRIVDCPDCAVRWSASLEADGPVFEKCPQHRA